MSPGQKATILASATGGNRAPWVILGRPCTKRVVRLQFLVFLYLWASWKLRALAFAWWITIHERWAPAIRNQVFLRFKGSPRTLFRGVLHTLQESARPLQVNPPPLVPGRRFVLVTGVF